MSESRRREEAQLPVRPFLYTLDQVAYILDMREEVLRGSYLHFMGRTGGAGRRHFITARDISPPRADHPDWRVAEEELLRWMKLKGFRFKQGLKLWD